MGRRGPQGVARRVLWNLLPGQRPRPVATSRGGGGSAPVGLAARTAPAITKLAARFDRADDATRSPTSRRLLGCSTGSTATSPTASSAATEPNVADLQIATSVALLMTMEDLRPHIAERAAGGPGDPARPRLPRPHAAGLPGPAGWSHSAASPEPLEDRAERLDALPRAERGEAFVSRVPSGSARSGSSSSSGTSTKRREPPRGGAASAAPSAARSRRAGADRRRPAAGCAGGRRSRGPLRLDRLADVEQRLRLETGRIRIARLRKSGWSRISPDRLGLVAEEPASTATPRSRRPSTAVRRLAPGRRRSSRGRYPPVTSSSGSPMIIDLTPIRDGISAQHG